MSDTQFGLLSGTAFVALYCVCGIPLGWLADRTDRRALIALGLLIWSAMTAACAMTSSFGAFFLARVGVGLGEACLVPAAISLLGNVTRRRQVAQAVAIFLMGAAVGNVFALLAGGRILERIGPTTIPARIGIAQADLYPRFSLTGVAGLESLYFSSFGNASSGYYQIGPGVTWRIFDAGRIRFEVQAESARTATATAAYERSVLGAFRDVETALVSYANIKVRRNELAAESAADAQATDIAELLYERGVESFLPVLDAERSLYAADDALAQSERDSALALIALYKSLGGGWPSASAEMSIGK